MIALVEGYRAGLYARHQWLPNIIAGLVVGILVKGGGPVLFDAGRAAQSILLAAWSEGLASCPNGIVDGDVARLALAASPDEEPVIVLGDAARLHQVLTNLLANARVHTSPGTVVTTRLDSDGTHAALSVCDNGPGIPERLQSEVFERFARGANARGAESPGAGLGLAIVRTIVEAHGGTVSIRSVEGAGTTVQVELPLALS